MNARRAAPAALALAVLLASCGSPSTPAAPERPGLDYPLNGVVSVCDRFGNRVYRSGVAGDRHAGVAVAPQDPSCTGTSRSSSEGAYG